MPSNKETKQNQNITKVFTHPCIVNDKAFCLDVAQGRKNRAPNETRIHSWRSASQDCQPITPSEAPC